MRFVDEAVVVSGSFEAPDSEHVAVRCHLLRAHDLCCWKCLDQRDKSMRHIYC